VLRTPAFGPLTLQNSPAATKQKVQIADVQADSHLSPEIVFAHDMASNSAAIAPLLKADTATLTFSASKDGKLRVTYAGW
jgi:hypothetical protein